MTEAGSLARQCADAMYAEDRAARRAGITIDLIEPGRAAVRMTVTDAMINGHDICHGTGAQQRRPQSNGALVNPQSAKCLDDPNSSTAPGTQLQIYTCNGTNAQRWQLP